MSPVRVEYTGVLTERHFVTSDVLIFRVSRPAGFEFKAGQFVQFKIPTSTEPVWRSYSIASAPNADYLEFCIKILPGGAASQYFNVLSLNSEVIFSAAQGFFVVTPAALPTKVFVATGTGITPILSILADQPTEFKAGESQTVLFGVRTEHDVFWHDRLAALKKDLPSFDYSICLSGAHEPAKWQGRIGRVTAHLPTLPELAEYYVCGSLEMIKDVRSALLVQKVPMKHIHFEIF